MNTREVANRLVELCRNYNFEAAQDELYAQDSVSIEERASPDFEKETKGLAAIKEKAEKWNAMIEEFRSITVSEPVVAGNSFACTMQMDVVMKGHGPMNMTELCIYKVKDGKIVIEEFFS